MGCQSSITDCPVQLTLDALNLRLVIPPDCLDCSSFKKALNLSDTVQQDILPERQEGVSLPLREIIEYSMFCRINLCSRSSGDRARDF